MKKKDCVVGMEVIASVRSSGYDYSELVSWFSGGDEVSGVISDSQSNSDDNTVSVNWNKSNYNRLDSETNAELLSPLSAKPELEAKFKELEKQVRFKCEQAALLINEANKMAILGGAPALSDMLGSDCLYSAMDNAGWQMSSIGC